MSVLHPRLPSVWLTALAAAIALLLPAPAVAQQGAEPERVSRASSLEPGHGAVIVSVRSELFLLSKLNVYFVREGGDIANEADIVRFTRSQPTLSFGNTTTKYKVLSFQLPAGRYRLAGHGAKCTKVPEPDERCLVDVKVAGIGETVSFPSRGYGEGSPVFEVREGALTIAGDFALTARNTLEWSVIPPDKLKKVVKKFAELPQAREPLVAEEFRLKYPLRPRSFEDDRGRRY
ncbi:MAG: hypothetical protein AAFZ11_05590 [Pseudomonadota bacterium]